MTYQAKIRIFYPLNKGQIVLRTAQNWDQDIEATHVNEANTIHEFTISNDTFYLDFKPCIRDDDRFFWAEGTNKLLFLGDAEAQDFYPHFYTGQNGRVTGLIEVPSNILNHHHRLRIYLPAGFDENTLKHYPVLYMHDGSNLFFPDEAFFGQEWHVDEHLDLLDRMNAIDRIIVVGIYAEDRFQEYTKPGYQDYGRALVEEIKPVVDANLRTLTDASHTGVMGSSLGGVVSFFLAWEWPHIFGNAACMSSTFSYQDDLIERVRTEPRESRKHLKLYLDSGWPGDNYETTLSMASMLIESGFKLGRDFYHFTFPLSAHSEADWSERYHLPVQLFSGKLRRAAERQEALTVNPDKPNRK